MPQTKMVTPKPEGVEENKEEDPPMAANQQISPRISKSQENDEQERTHGFQAQMQNLVEFIFGSCGQALEAASVFAQGQGCDPRWQQQPPAHRQAHAPHVPTSPQPQPLSIADELRQLAAKEGRPFPEMLPVHPRAADIPRFLGEDAVRSFEDDEVSAISQHTLEEMARNGIVHPVSKRILQHQQQQRDMLKQQAKLKEQEQTPSCTESNSLSSSSSKKKGEESQEAKKAEI